MKQTITILGRRIRTQQLVQLINNTLGTAETLHQQVQNALLHGVAPQTAYNLPAQQLQLLRRYERARQLYQEYQHAIHTPRADHIITPAAPTTPKHLLHFYCGTTSNKNEYAYTRYKVVLAKNDSRTLHIVCDCPDYTNRGGSYPCKHALLACMWLRDMIGGGGK